MKSLIPGLLGLLALASVLPALADGESPIRSQDRDRLETAQRADPAPAAEAQALRTRSARQARQCDQSGKQAHQRRAGAAFRHQRPAR